MNRRDLFKGLLGLGAVKILAPATALFSMPVLMKYRQPGISTFHISYVQTDTVMIFKPKFYYVSATIGKEAL